MGSSSCAARIIGNHPPERWLPALTQAPEPSWRSQVLESQPSVIHHIANAKPYTTRPSKAAPKMPTHAAQALHQCGGDSHRVREDKCTLPRATDKAEERANKVPRHTWFPHHALASAKSTTSKGTIAAGSALWCIGFSHWTHPVSAPAVAQDPMTPQRHLYHGSGQWAVKQMPLTPPPDLKPGRISEL